jgi:glycosyltransferase involved in cell wall biosynthesis
MSQLAPEPLEHPAITTVAGMYYRKGILELIDAFNAISAKYPRAHLYIVGDGPDRRALERIALASPARGRIHFEGFQKHAQRYMLSSEIFVLPSHCDSFPLVIPEAREAGCAIVATEVDGIPEALDGGSAGILVPVKNVSALSSAIDALLGNTELLRDWQERASMNLQWLSAERLCDETTAVYRTIRGDAAPMVRVNLDARHDAQS